MLLLPVFLVLAVFAGALTAYGAWKARGYGVAAAAIAGLCFPVTWSYWYCQDELPIRCIRAVGGSISGAKS